MGRYSLLPSLESSIRRSSDEISSSGAALEAAREKTGSAIQAEQSDCFFHQRPDFYKL
jgi:hypothetical protein